ncbi:hypothetical protein E1A91_D11G168800v1 [Gossypium mustelinum]|uniref:F-box domain-containing protein n=1 Tax=Gossypium mustelinum TaxID=34275 RepID=A0A5D2SV66_GOSMU|nr:hypothetical protein E1A91_D11G168800v1 [Gossypium mustelinum]
MDRLPQEVALEILSRLPLLSLVQSKSVCRAWRTFIQDQLLVNKHFKHMVENDPSFILQIMGHCIQKQLYFGDLSSDPNDENVMMIAKKLTIPTLLSFHLVSSCNGLLLLSATHPSFELCIYNPFTRDYVELPKRSHHAGVLGFGFDPTTKKYKVVEISYKRTTHLYFRRRVVRFGMRPASQTAASSVEIHILTVSSNTWRNLGSFPFRFVLQKSQVLVNGKLHWRATTNLIMSFDLATEQFKEVPSPDFIASNRRIHELVVLRGCLSAVSFDDDNQELEIWVMKEYDVKESWVKQFSIGAYVPKILQPNYQCHSSNDPRFHWRKKWIQVLCLLKSGGLLLQYRNKALVVYDPHCRTFQDVEVPREEIPRCLRTVVHVASLNWIGT